MADRKHTKIRFGSDADKKLRTLPSHGVDRGPVHAPLLAPPHMVRRRVIATTLLLLFACFVGLGVFLASGSLMPLLRDQAQQALLRVVPDNLKAELGKTDVAFLWPPQLGITYDDVRISNLEGELQTSVERLTLGIAPGSLLRGQPEFTSVSVQGVDYQMPNGGENTLPDMRIDKAQNVFESVAHQMAQIGGKFVFQDGGMTVSLKDVVLTLPSNGYSDRVELSSIAFKAKNGIAEFIGDAVIDGYQVPLTGNLRISPDNADEARTVNLTLNAKSLPLPWRRLQTLVSNDLADQAEDMRHAPVLADVTLYADDFPKQNIDRFELGVEPKQMVFKLAEDDFVPVDGKFAIAMDFGGGAITIKPDDWSVGRTDFILSGRVRDSIDLAERNSFDFEMLANRGNAAAADSPSDPLKFAARARGSLALDRKLIRFSKLEVDSDKGRLDGNGDISLGDEFQTAIFEVLVNDMTIGGVKQLWPAPVARAARLWMLNNLAGGRVTSGRFDIAEPLRRRIPGTDQELTGATKVDLSVEGVRFDVVGDLPPVREADGRVVFADGLTTVTLAKGSVYLPSGRVAAAKDGTLLIRQADPVDGKIRASLDLGVSGEARALGELISLNPISAQRYYQFLPKDLKGTVDGRVSLDFLLNGGSQGPQPDWSVDFAVANAGSAAKIEGRIMDGLSGRVKVDTRRADFDVKGNIDGLPADIAVVIPFGNSGVAAKRSINLTLSSAEREKLAPGLDTILTGVTPVNVSGSGKSTRIEANLTRGKLNLPWIGWSKGAGIKATAAFDLVQNGSATSLTDFKLSGNSFGINKGRIDVDKAGFKNARFGFAQLNKGDNFTLDINRNGQGYAIAIGGKALDGRAMMRHVRAEAKNASGSSGSVPVDVTAKLGRVTGFHGEYLNNVQIEMRVRSGTVTRFNLSGTTKSGFPVILNLEGAGSGRTIKLEALGAGEFLRFADIYTNVRGGTLNVSLRGSGPASLAGKADLFDFRIFNEPKLAQLVSSGANGSQSLEQAVNKRIDTNEVKFERATTDIAFKPGRLDIDKAFIKGEAVGLALKGMVFDSKNQTRLTGTFLPAYGLNSLFSDIPILGALLGNGSDRGLIGVTFKLEGSFDSPKVTVNPLSAIAPGIFRSIFEFQ